MPSPSPSSAFQKFGVLLLIAVMFLMGSAKFATADDDLDKLIQERTANKDERLEWWREARFGLFIHWGLYAIPGGEWKGKKVFGGGEWIQWFARIPVAEYKQLGKQFNPVKFDALAWVKLAKQAGMKYIVITSKHHDGFAMYHSNSHPFNIVDATPFNRDPLKELAAACKAEGIKLGFYYSHAQDWTHPGGVARHGNWDKAAQDGSLDKYVEEKAIPQIREILTDYGEISVLWWDTPYDITKPQATKLLKTALTLQPNIITNNRLHDAYQGDSGTPEQHIPGSKVPGDWETCMTMNTTWGYKHKDHDWKSVTVLVRNLIDIASKGGNYLLNVGPTAEGEIPLPSVYRMEKIGEWMKVHGESIYGTQASPLEKTPTWGRITQKPGKLYLHVFDWPADGTLKLSGLAGTISKCSLLSDAKQTSLPMTAEESGSVSITVPKEMPNSIATVIVAEYEAKTP